MKKKILFLLLSLVLVLTAVSVSVFAESEEITSKTAPFHRETVLENGDIKTVYGTIPSEYSDAATYPIIVFHNDEFLSATDVFATSEGGAFQTAKSKMDNNSERNNQVEIYLRADINVTARHSNTGHMSGTLIVDLNGYTMRHSKYMIYNAEGKKYDEIYPLRIVTQNGDIEMNGAPLLKCGAYGEAYADLETAIKTMNFDFDNIKFYFIDGATTETFLAKYEESTSITTGKKTMVPVTFTNCIFDFTKAPDGITLFNAEDPDITQSHNVVQVTVKGCEFKMNDANKYTWYTLTEGNGSSVIFAEDDNGNYPTVTLPASAPSPKVKLLVSGGKELLMVKAGETDDVKIYKIGVPSPSDFGFKLKTSLTLDTNIVLNLYISKTGIKEFDIDGKLYNNLSSLSTKEISGETYYLVPIPLASSEIARDVVLKATLANGETEETFSYNLNVPKYAEKILSDDTVSDNTKILVNDILSYSKAAYEYFGENGKAEFQRIENLLDIDYNEMSVVTVEGPIYNSYEGLLSATFVLDSAPSIRFYLPEDANYGDYKFYIDGKEIKTVYNEEEHYIDTDVYAYALCETVTYSIGGEMKDGYHINSYYKYAKETLADDKLVNVVERFWKYLQSARTYRLEVLGDSSVAHTHTYFDREIEMSAYTPHYTEKVCACGESQKTLLTGIEFGDKEVSVYFLGNSYTNYNNMSSMFESIAESMGLNVAVTKRTKGGWHLWKYAKPNDDGGALFYQDMENQDFDYAFLQDGSTQTLAAIGEFYDGVRLVGELLENDGAKILLYQTWGRKEGHAVLDQYNLTTETMAWTVGAAYEAIAKETGYTLSPAGSAFLDIYQNHPEIDLYDSDLTHPSATGSYLVALCHYATLFGRSPIGVTYTAGLDAETALILQEAAYNAVFGESIIPEEYKTSSEGVGVVFADNNLTVLPEGSNLISVGILGDKGTAASSVTVAKDAELTDEQRLDMSDIGYGVSIIGNKNMVTSLSRAADGTWGSSRLSFDFCGNHYDITGDIDEHEPYQALITYNFGGIVNITAIGYMSGNMDGFAQAQDVYISNDGISWSVVPSASYDAVLLEAESGALKSLETLPTDKSGNTPGVCVVFDMNSANGGVYAKYVRFGIKTGVVVSNKQYDINTYELAVWGRAENSYLTAIPEDSTLISGGLTASSSYNTTELTDTEKADISDMSKYGATLIGAKTLARSIKYVCNGLWSDGKRLTANFYDDNGSAEDTIILYDINGNESDSGKYECLITYNFGSKVTLDAIGYMSGDMNGFAQNQEVWVSNDGENWIKVTTACYDRTSGDTQEGVTDKPTDSNGKTSGICVMFEMGGIKAQYVRVAIIDGMSNNYANDMNTLELAVYGKEA